MPFPAATARALLAGFRALGLDADALRREAGIDPEVLARLDGVLERDCFGRLWAAAFARAPRQELPTEVGMAVPFGAMGALDYLVGTSGNVEAGFMALARHIRQVTADFSIEISQSEAGSGLVQLVWPKPLCNDAEQWWSSYHSAASTENHQDPSDEFTLAICVAHFRSSVAGCFRASAVHLTRPIPQVPTSHARLFNAPVVFGCAVSALVIEPASWRLALRRADPTLQELLRTLASGLELGEVGSDLEAVLRARLRILLPDGCPSAAAVARSVGLTERTLQRQLKQAGTSFTRVLDNFRETEAERLLASEIPLTEVALRLGFSDQTSWNRAFRRWKGTSPRQWVLAQPEAALRRSSVSRM